MCLIPDSFIKALQKWDTKSLSQSVINLRGQPFSQNHVLIKIVANSSAIMFVLQGATWILAPSLSVMVMIASKPSSLGSGPTKSIAIELNRLSGTGKG